MLIPLKWLKEYVDIDLTPAELADKLVSCGFEIEQIIDLSDKFSGVVTAKVVSLEKHPAADRLKVAKLDIGKSDLLQVVTNATNIKEGDIVPVATDGARLATGLNIKSGELRGVASYGMLCGGEEIAADDNDYPGASQDGVLVFAPETPVGADVNVILGRDEIVLDVGITSNRTDANSVYGIAREVAAVTGKPLKPLNLSYAENKEDISSYIGLDNLAPDLCPRYMGKVVKNVKICPSPEIIKQRLRAVGLRPINNIVDITNYVLFEIGQPMHAFDIEAIEGGRIVVRRAEKDEKIVCLDEKEYTLNENNLVIANTKRGMAVAGIMGGRDFSVLDTTSTIVFESARFARDNVRRTSRSLNLRSDSSARFEKGIDYWSQEAGMNRALALIHQYGWGEIVGGVADSFPNKPEEKRIEFKSADIEKILGISVPESEILHILNALTIQTRKEGDKFVSIVPPYREDMVGVNDIAEEVIRIYGYSHITPTLMKYAKMVVGGRSKQQETAEKIKNILLAEGCHETVTYSFISPKAFDSLCLPEGDKLRNAIRLDNPLGEDFSVMRTTMAHSMIKTIATNYLRGNKALRLFEVAKTYIPKELPLNDYPIEKNTLIIGSLGDDYYAIKSILENLLSALRIEAEFVRGTRPYLHLGRCAEISVNGSVIGYIGEVSDIVAANYDIDKRVYIAEVDFEYLVENARPIRQFRTVPKFPMVERDIAVVCSLDTEASKLLKIIEKTAGTLLIDSYVFDVYTGGQVESGKKSVAINMVFQSAEKTLKDEDVNALIANILNALAREADAKLR